jgi:hypothetical protein
LLPPWILRTFTLGSFRLHMLRVKLILGPPPTTTDDDDADETSDESDEREPTPCDNVLWSNPVALVDWMVAKGRAPGGLTAVETGRFPGWGEDGIPSLAPSARKLSGWVPYYCYATNRPHGVNATTFNEFFRLNVAAGWGCVAGATDIAYDESFFFIVLNMGLALLLTLATLWKMRQVIVAQYLAGLHDVGPAVFLVRARAVETTRDRFMKHVCDASGPLYFMDYLVSSPMRCSMLSLRDACLSAVLHWLVVALPAAPLVALATLAGCTRELTSQRQTPTTLRACRVPAHSRATQQSESARAPLVSRHHAEASTCSTFPKTRRASTRRSSSISLALSSCSTSSGYSTHAAGTSTCRGACRRRCAKRPSS